MGTVIHPKENKVKTVIENAPNSNSVPALRDEVKRLADAVEEIKKRMNKL